MNKRINVDLDHTRLVKEGILKARTRNIHNFIKIILYKGIKLRSYKKIKNSHFVNLINFDVKKIYLFKSSSLFFSNF